VNENIEGIIIGAANTVAKIKISRHGDCCNCGACPGESAMIIQAHNKIGARLGQHVLVETKFDNRVLLQGAFFIFCLPLLAILIGVIGGLWIAFLLKISVAVPVLACGMLLFLIVIWVIKRFDATLRLKKDLPVIIKTID
jgi:sigma-E factor negative regulatory protein RseC